MKKQKFLMAVLALALSLSLFVLPVSAATLSTTYCGTATVAFGENYDIYVSGAEDSGYINLNLNIANTIGDPRFDSVTDAYSSSPDIMLSNSGKNVMVYGSVAPGTYSITLKYFSYGNYSHIVTLHVS